MAYLKDKEMIFHKMQTNKLAFYKVLDSDGKTILDRQDDDDCTVTEAENRLRDTLENLTGLITVVLSEKTSKQKAAGGNTTGDLRFSIKLTDGTSSSITGVNDGAIEKLREAMQREFDAKLLAIKKEHEAELRIKKLEDQILELKNGNSLDQYLPMIAGLFSPGSAPVIAGFPNEPHITGPDDFKTRLITAVNRLTKVDKNFVSNLEALADLAEKSPITYNLAISKLHSL